MAREWRDVLIALIVIGAVVWIVTSVFDHFAGAFTMASDVMSLVTVIVGVIGTIAGVVFGASAGAQAGAGERARLTQELNTARGVIRGDQALSDAFRAQGGHL
jgi:type IV secretory pathway VirB2 component (pilin)